MMKGIHSENGWIKKVKKQKVLLLFLFPSVVFILVFNYFPMAGIVMAFQDYDIYKGFLGSAFAGLIHFKEFLAEPDFYVALKNTLGMNILCLLLAFPLTIVFAVLLNEFAYTRLKKIVQTITYLPHFVSWVIVAGLFYKMLDEQTGIVNVLRGYIGLDKVAYFREPAYFWGIIILSVIWKEIGWNSIIYLSAMTSIDQQQYEAAIVDGANRFRRIWHITIPGILPTVSLMLILTVGSIVNVSGGGGGTVLPTFDAVFNMRNALVWSKSDVIDIYAYMTGVQQGYYSFATAIGVTQSLISLALLFSANSLVKRMNGSSLF